MAATVDDLTHTENMAREIELTFPVGYGLVPTQLAQLDPWWANDHHGQYPQPMEFLIDSSGLVLGSLYASGPVGRMDATEVLVSIEKREQRRLEAA